MFTVLAIVIGVSAAVGSHRANSREHPEWTEITDDLIRQSILHSRQDLKLIAFILLGILFMLGIIADRIH